MNDENESCKCRTHGRLECPVHRPKPAQTDILDMIVDDKYNYVQKHVVKLQAENAALRLRLSEVEAALGGRRTEEDTQRLEKLAALRVKEEK